MSCPTLGAAVATISRAAGELPAATYRRKPGAIVSIVGDATILLGTLLPWVSIDSTVSAAYIEKSGMDCPDGPLALIAGLVRR